MVLDIQNALLGHANIGFCTNIWVFNNRTLVEADFSAQSLPTVTVSLDGAASRLGKLTEMLQKNAPCIVAVTSEDGALGNLLEISLRFRKALLVKIGGFRPKESEISISNHPLVWMDERNVII